MKTSNLLFIVIMRFLLIALKGDIELKRYRTKIMYSVDKFLVAQYDAYRTHAFLNYKDAID